MLIRISAFAGVVIVALFPAVVLAEDTWQAGTARVEITPEQPMWMSGYASRDKPAAGKLTELWAKALCLEDATGHRGVLVTLDLIGIDRELSTSICETLHERYGLDRSQIAICCSHTHTGPALRRNLAPIHYLLVATEQQRLIDAYTEWLEGKVVAVVGEAIDAMAPARLSWDIGTATFAVNRRENRPEGNVPQWRTEGRLKGPVDHTVPVLAVRDNDGNLQTVVFGYACHATVLSFYQWSGDFPGFAQAELEDLYPGVTAMFWAGCGADQNPLPRRSVELARHYGRRLADAVDAVLMTADMHEVTGSLRTAYGEIALPFAALPSRDQIERDAKSEDRYTAARAKMFLDRLDAGGSLEPAYPYPIEVWKLGDDLTWILLGGEVVVDFAIRLRGELGGSNTWVAGYANDVMAYIPSRRVLLEGGYEGGGAMVYYGLPSPWADSVEQLIVEEVHRQVGAVK